MLTFKCAESGWHNTQIHGDNLGIATYFSGIQADFHADLKKHALIYVLFGNCVLSEAPCTKVQGIYRPLSEIDIPCGF